MQKNTKWLPSLIKLPSIMIMTPIMTSEIELGPLFEKVCHEFNIKAQFFLAFIQLDAIYSRYYGIMVVLAEPTRFRATAINVQ